MTEQKQRVRSHTRTVGGKTVHVGSHNRDARRARLKANVTNAGYAGANLAAILLELTFTSVYTLALLVLTVLGTVAVIAGRYAEANRRAMTKQSRGRRPQARRTTRPRARTTRTRATRRR